MHTEERDQLAATAIEKYLTYEQELWSHVVVF